MGHPEKIVDRSVIVHDGDQLVDQLAGLRPHDLRADQHAPLRLAQQFDVAVPFAEAHCFAVVAEGIGRGQIRDAQRPAGLLGEPHHRHLGIRKDHLGRKPLLVAGIPLLYLYLFALWVVLVAIAGIVVTQLVPNGEPKPPAPAPAAAASVEASGRIDISEFAKVELRVARVLAAEKIAGSRKLLKLQVDLGGEQRQLVAGIAESYAPEALVGKTVAVVANLKPAKLMGVESNGMVLAASPGDGAVLLTLDGEAAPGTRIK